MPSQLEHTRQWQSNHSLLAQVMTQIEYPDWVITLAFYTALHSTERFLARQKVHPQSHSIRDVEIQQFAVQLTRPVLRAYAGMKNASRNARYNCPRLTAVDVQQQLQRLALIDRHIAQLL
jgi:hypothetical protein